MFTQKWNLFPLGVGGVCGVNLHFDLVPQTVLDVDNELGERLQLETAAPEPAGYKAKAIKKKRKPNKTLVVGRVGFKFICLSSSPVAVTVLSGWLTGTYNHCGVFDTKPKDKEKVKI